MWHTIIYRANPRSRFGQAFSYQSNTKDTALLPTTRVGLPEWRSR